MQERIVIKEVFRVGLPIHDFFRSAKLAISARNLAKMATFGKT